MPTDFRNILLIKPSSLGDIVHALPTAAVLRRRFPAALLTWLVKREWADVLEGNPCIVFFANAFTGHSAGRLAGGGTSGSEGTV